MGFLAFNCCKFWCCNLGVGLFNNKVYMKEKALEDIHYLEVLREAALYNERVAFHNLQTARTEFDRIHECQEIETWKGILVLIKQREDLVKNIKLLILESRVPADVVCAVKENLKDMGINL